MKTWIELTLPQQAKAVEQRLNWILENICAGNLRFKDLAMQAAVDKASEEAESMRTPWFMPGYVMDKIGNELQLLAREECAAMLYIEPHETAMEEPMVGH